MVEVNADCERDEDVTLVSATVTNTRSIPQAVRLASTLSGPVWPPEQDGTLVAGWDGDTWEATLRPGQSIGLGFATSAEPVDDPIEVVDTSPVDSEDLRSQNPKSDLAEWSPPSGLHSEEL